jgi:ACS family sodium-dependent inorganic phosphate cotransporter
MIHHMLRLNISIAIVEMTIHNNSNASVKGPRYHWNEEEKNEILGSFFWGYFVMQIPGGRLSEIFGPRIVLGTGLLIAALLTILTPVTCKWGFYWVVLARFALGLSLGVQWPSIPPLAAKWVSSTDTSKFMAHMMASALGAALTLPMCGHLIAQFGWPSVFYVTGTITLLCTIAWFYLAYDSPEQHPRISDKEREALKAEVNYNQIEKNNKSPPWGKMFTSGPVWALIVGNSFSSFTVFIALFQMPSYISQVLHMDIMVNGWLSGLPHIGNKSQIFVSFVILFFFSKIHVCGYLVVFS